MGKSDVELFSSFPYPFPAEMPALLPIVETLYMKWTYGMTRAQTCDSLYANRRLFIWSELTVWNERKQASLMGSYLVSFTYPSPVKIRLHYRRLQTHFDSLHKAPQFTQTYNITRSQIIVVCEIAIPFPLAQEKINEPVNDHVWDAVAEWFQCGTSWRTLAGDLQPKIKDCVMDAIEEDKRWCPKECCGAVLKTCYQRHNLCHKQSSSWGVWQIWVWLMWIGKWWENLDL